MKPYAALNSNILDNNLAATVSLSKREWRRAKMFAR
jgi:hypothetical protein